MYLICDDVNLVELFKTNLRFLKRGCDLKIHIPLIVYLFAFVLDIGFHVITFFVTSALALLGVRTADAFFTALLGSYQIPNDTADNCRENHYDDYIFIPNSLFLRIA